MTFTKRCPKCGETKPLDGFYRNRSQRDGLTSQCKECHRSNQRAYYEANRGKINDRKRAYNEAHQEEIRARNRAYDDVHREDRRAYQREHYRILGHPTVERWNEIAAKHATRKSEPWSEAEDAYLAASTARILDEAIELKRTFSSVASRRSMLRKRGVILARDTR